MSLAGQVATVHSELEKVKALYTQLWRAKTGSMRDPFEDGTEVANGGGLGCGYGMGGSVYGSAYGR